MGGNGLRGFLYFLVAIFAFIGVSAAETIQDRSLIFRSEGSVSGEGYFAAGEHLMMPLGVEARSYCHGSGWIYAERQILAQSSDHSSPDDNCTDNDYLFNNTTYSSIWMKEDRKMISAPIVLAQGKGYFADHPLTFQLPVADATWAMSRDDCNSMHRTVAYAGALAGEFEVSVENYVSETDVQLLNIAQARENITAGMVDIGIDQLDVDEDEDAEIVEQEEMEDEDLIFAIDESYVGTFQIVLNAILPDEEDEDDEEDDEEKDYISCCDGQCQNASSEDDGNCSRGGSLSSDDAAQELNRTVRGEGYFSTYRYLATPDELEIESSARGSGAIESEWQFTGQSDKDNCSLIDCSGNSSPDVVQRDHSQMSFGPTIIAVGKGFYADHPLIYRSLLRDATGIKDSINVNSMHQEVERAHGLSKELGIAAYDIEDEDEEDEDENCEVECGSCCRRCGNSIWKNGSGCGQEDDNGCYNATAEPASDEITTRMNLSEKVIEGRARTAFSVLSNCADGGDDGENETRSKCAIIQVDEEYAGTFSIDQNMTFTTPDADQDDNDDDQEDMAEMWLQHCSCGYWDANLYDYS